MISWVYFAGAAVLEIAGCFAVWAWLREGRSPLWLIPGALSLLGFAWLLTRAETAHAGRAYAAYGGVYVAASILWLWLVERQAPDRWDLVGMAACLVGSAIILAPRAAT
ncbi:MAG: YnfA family protein [Phenylobacterium zucineum]|nr:MAG: YnfA family protein [Phenylobacterium zucineum]